MHLSLTSPCCWSVDVDVGGTRSVSSSNKVKSAIGKMRKVWSYDIAATEERQKVLHCAMASLQKDANTIPKKANKTNSMALVNQMHGICQPRSRLFNCLH